MSVVEGFHSEEHPSVCAISLHMRQLIIECHVYFLDASFLITSLPLKNICQEHVCPFLFSIGFIYIIFLCMHFHITLHFPFKLECTSTPVLETDELVLYLAPATLLGWRLYNSGRQRSSCGAASCVQAWPPKQEDSGCQGENWQITWWNSATHSA